MGESTCTRNMAAGLGLEHRVGRILTPVRVGIFLYCFCLLGILLALSIIREIIPDGREEGRQQSILPPGREGP